MPIHRVVRVFILIATLLLPAVLAAQPHQESGAIPVQGPVESESVKDLKKAMEKKANKQRQEQIRRDTEKLLKLATELKDYVDKTDEHILSLDVIKKAEEIEKLAHSVKDKMKANY